MKHFCASHSRCYNDSCLKKPTNDELHKYREGQIEATWADYHLPVADIKCQYFIGESKNAR